MSNSSMQYDGLVICSTQNQMVNYLTILQHKDVPIIYITLGENNEDSSQKCQAQTKEIRSNLDNAKWDEYLKKQLETKILHEFSFDSQELSSHQNIIGKLKKEIDDSYKNILWSVTGGQRHIVMAITEYVFTHRKDQDAIVYFEGDQSKFYYYFYNKDFKQNTEVFLSTFDHDKLNLEIAFKLMGFDLTDNSTSKNLNECRYFDYLTSYGINYDKDKWRKYNNEQKFYNNLFKDFEESKDLQLLHTLMKSNKTSQNSEKLSANDLINELLRLNLSCFSENEDVEIFRGSLKNGSGAIFGYIFEYMVFYKIMETIKKKGKVNAVADIYLSAKAKYPEKEYTEKLGIIDEFDITILTKSGKVIVFECKSGNFTGDNMKSHHYSTYAVSGVYGTPILIMPVTDAMLRVNDPFITEVKSREKKARRANVEIWRLNELSTKLDKLLSKENI